MDEQEQNEKIEKLETSLEELSDLVNGLMEEQPEDNEQEFFEVNYDSKSFIIHWVEDSEHSTIDNYADAKAEFLSAALARDNTEGKTPVQHGDVMVIGTACPWIALCVVVDSFDQREDPHAPEVAASDETTIGDETVVRREFVVWNACGDPNVDPPEPCERNPSLDVVAQYVHDFSVTHTQTDPVGGTGEPQEKTHTITISKTLKEMVFDNCGRFVEIRSIPDESPTVIEIKECCVEDEPEPGFCEGHINEALQDSYTVTSPTGAFQPQTVTRTVGTGCSQWNNADGTLFLIGDVNNGFTLSGSILGDPCGNGNNIGRTNDGSPIGQYSCWLGIGNGFSNTINAVVSA